MTFNVDPVGATLLTVLLGVLWRGWDSITKRIEDRHVEAMKRLDNYHSENRARLEDLADEKEIDHGRIFGRLEDHHERIAKLRGDVDVHGYRITAVESAKR